VTNENDEVIFHHIFRNTKYARGEHNKLIRAEFGCHRLLLHSSSLKLYHPYLEKDITIEADFDEVFKKLFLKFGWSITR